jgi:hypothetical protein
MCTVRFVFVHVCVVVWRDSPLSKYLNTPPEARHSQRKKQKKMKGMTREKEMITPWNHTNQSVTNQNTPKTSLKANQDPRIQMYSPKILIRLLRSSVPQS